MIKKTFLLLFAFAAIAFCTAFIPARDGYKVGDKAEDFTLKNVDGRMVSLKKL